MAGAAAVEAAALEADVAVDSEVAVGLAGAVAAVEGAEIEADVGSVGVAVVDSEVSLDHDLHHRSTSVFAG